MPASLKSIGTAVPVLVVLALIFWIYMLWSVSAWISKTPPAGRETDKVMLQVFTGGLALVVWLLVGALLVLADTKASMPSPVGVACWLLHPVSFVFAAIAITVMYDAEWRWTVVIPAVAPVLIAAYAISLILAAGRPFPPAWGLGMWATVLLLCVSVIPAAVRFKEKHLPKSDSVQATPGPELDRFLARERERRRQSGLDEIRAVNPDTRLGDLENLVRDDSPVRSEALEAMRKLPNRQSDAEKALFYEYSWILPFLPEVDLSPTPTLCEGARHYLQSCVRDVRSVHRVGPGDRMGMILEEGIHGIEWIARNCDFTEELDALDRVAQEQNDTPEVRQFRESLKSFRQAK